MIPRAGPVVECSTLYKKLFGTLWHNFIVIYVSLYKDRHMHKILRIEKSCFSFLVFYTALRKVPSFLIHPDL